MQKIVAMLLAVMMLCSCAVALADSPAPVTYQTVTATVKQPVVELVVTDASQALEAAMAAAENAVDVYDEATVAEITKVIGDKSADSLKAAEISGIAFENVKGNEDLVLNFVFLTEFSKDQVVVAVVTIGEENTVLVPTVEDDGSLTITFPAKLAKAIEKGTNAVLTILVG